MCTKKGIAVIKKFIHKRNLALTSQNLIPLCKQFEKIEQSCELSFVYELERKTIQCFIGHRNLILNKLSATGLINIYSTIVLSDVEELLFHDYTYYTEGIAYFRGHMSEILISINSFTIFDRTLRTQLGRMNSRLPIVQPNQTDTSDDLIVKSILLKSLLCEARALHDKIIAQHDIIPRFDEGSNISSDQQVQQHVYVSNLSQHFTYKPSSTEMQNSLSLPAVPQKINLEVQQALERLKQLCID